MPNEKILVDVARSRQARAFPEGERLWQLDLKRVKRMITRHAKQLKKPVKLFENRPTLAIAIFGPAGSGKSSILKTLVQETQGRDSAGHPLAAKRKSEMEHVTALDMIQPARFAPGDHLIYAVIAAALDAHRSRQDREKLDYEVLSSVLHRYRDLAEDLHAVHREATVHEHEPVELATERIQRHTSGLRLQKKMQHFITEVAADLCGSRDAVIILPVDDLDLAQSHFLQSLRALQAYLLHPQLVPVFTFTDRLAEEILIGEFRKSFYSGRELERNDRTDDRLNVSRHLAIQYLAKCFPIRNRLRLGPAAAILQTADAKPEDVKGGNDSGSEPTLVPLVAASELLFGHPDRSSRHPVGAALRPTTLRRQFQVIDSLRESGIGQMLADRHFDLAGIKKPETSKDGERETHWGRLFDQVTWALMNVHRDVLREYNLYLEDLYSWSPLALRRVILRELCGTDPLVQYSLWQRWRSLTDSRRSQVVSLIAANAHRPWMQGEPPSGDDLQSILSSRRLASEDSDPSNTQNKGNEETSREELDEVGSPAILLWFINVTLGFYLPMSWSVHRQLTAESFQTKYLSDAGWSLHSAPIYAAQAAYDAQKIFATGMVFLDPLSYATALTTAPRIAACAVLDEQLLDLEPEEEEHVARMARIAKLYILSERTNELLDEIHENEEGGSRNERKSGKSFRERHPRTWELYREAWSRYAEVAEWEITAPSVNRATNLELESLLKGRKYDEALDRLEKARNSRNGKKIEAARNTVFELRAAAAIVHDDQLLLRIWTCYGNYGGRFWAGISLWRGLGLLGQLIDFQSIWQKELDVLKKSKNIDEAEWMTQKIAGLVRTHCLRGLVPSMDLGSPNPDDSLELAFSEWNTLGQRRAIWRLSERLRIWLRRIQNEHATASPFKGAERWSSCVVRRMHGANIVGSFWTWLDAEHLEYQGRQYSKRRKYHWNAGLALTSWLRVFIRYFEGSYEERVIIETCPLVSPFLSYSARDPFLASLREVPYQDILKKTAEAVQGRPEDDKDGVTDMKTRHRFADYLGTVSSVLKALWRNPSDVCPSADGKGATATGDDPLKFPNLVKGDVNGHEKYLRKDVETFVRQVLEMLLADNSDREILASGDGVRDGDQEPRIAQAKVFADCKSHVIQLHRTAVALQMHLEDPARSIELSGEGYIRHVLDTLRPRIAKRDRKGRERNASSDHLDARSVRFEIASLINRHWKVAAHASTASLFYQIPRVRRLDVFSGTKSEVGAKGVSQSTAEEPGRAENEAAIQGSESVVARQGDGTGSNGPPLGSAS